MPARKPSGLIERHETNAETDARIASESALTPGRDLPVEPASLASHPVAAAEWRKLLRMYNSLDARIVSRLDMGMLLDYCILIEQLAEMDELRAATLKDWRAAQKILERYYEQIDEKNDDAEKPEIDLKVFAKAVEAVNWAFDKIVKLDGRIDRKRALLLQLRQSLYLTPRSRAGVAPAQKPPEEPDDDMTRLLKQGDYVQPGES